MKNKFFFIKENKVFKEDLISKVLKRFDEIYLEDNYKSLSPNVKELSVSDLFNEPLLLSMLNIIKDRFKLITEKSDLNFLKVWLVFSKSNITKENILPYKTHFDKQRRLKAMVYLHDIDLEHGPIHLGKVKNNIDIDQKRKELPDDFQKKGLNSINKSLLNGDVTPMTGKAGDVIFFDTNTPHKAGIIEDGFNRRILRFDFDGEPLIQRTNILSKFNNEIQNLFERTKKNFS